MDQLVINEMVWKNIYLIIRFNIEDISAYDFFITDLKHTYPLYKQNNELIINIVNIQETKLLDNGKWYLFYDKNGKRSYLAVSAECGYQLEHLDKVYRYGAECYAYVVNFQISDKESLENKIEQQCYDQSIHCDQADLLLCMFTTYMKRNDHPDKKDIRLESKSLKQAIRKLLFVVVKANIRMLYRILNAIRRNDGKHVLFMSETRVPISGNLKAIDDRMKQRGLDKEYIISYSFSKTLQQSKLKTFFTWSRLLWLIAKQDYIFVDDYVPIFKTIKLSEKTKLIQVWHAGVGFKSVGYSRFGKSGSPLPKDSCHRQYDYALVGSKGLIPVYEEVFGIDQSQFIATGLPRLDDYLNMDKIEAYKARFYADFPDLKGRRIIMFAPTYRGTTQKDAYYPYDKINMSKIAELCEKEYAFIFKMHPFITEKVEIPNEYSRYIKDVSDYGDINEIFYVTDILITDFSSNIYEFSLQRKPMIFYAFDKDFYQLTRGVHRTLDEAPGNVCETFDEVIDVIQTGNYDYDKLDCFLRESFDEHSELSSDLVIDSILLNNGILKE